MGGKSYHKLHNNGGKASTIPRTSGLECCVTSTGLCSVFLCSGSELFQYLGFVLPKIGQQGGVTGNKAMDVLD